MSAIVLPSWLTQGLEKRGQASTMTFKSQQHRLEGNVADVSLTVPMAKLQIINLERLQAGDLAESAKLFDAAKQNGFFYLNLQRVDGINILEMADQIYELAKELFNLDEAEKLAYDVDELSSMKSDGYKPMGRNFGGINGNRDGFESYSISKNGLLQLGDERAFPRSCVIDRHLETLQDFTRATLVVMTTILSSLSTSLGLPATERLESYHRAEVSSPDIIRLLKYHAQPILERGPPHTPHTDIGSLTMLFTRDPGLQVLPAGTDRWAYVAPRPGHAIINLGDGLSLMTDNVLRSCLHRVGPLPGRPMETRYSFAYLQRAEDRAPLAGLEGRLRSAGSEEEQRVITSGEWLRKKFDVLRLKTHREKQDWVLTGRKQAVPL